MAQIRTKAALHQMHTQRSSSTILAALLCTASLLVGSAVAAETPSADAQLEAARAAMDDLEYTQARDILVAVIAAPAVSQETLLRAHTLNGIVHRVLGNDVEARLSFVYVLERQPDLALPADLPPKVTSFFELIRNELKVARPKAVLSVKSEPPGAQVLLDGNDGGVTPVVYEIQPGWHDVVVISVRDGKASQAKVNVEALEGKDTGVHAELYLTTIAPDEQEAFGKRQVWHNIGMASKLITACLLVPSCGCCLYSNPAARGDLQALQTWTNVGCLGVSLFGLVTGLGIGTWGVFDIIDGPEPAEVRVYHRVTVTPPAGHGDRRVQEVEVGRLKED